MPKQYYRVKGYHSQRSIGYLLRRSGKLITARIEVLFVRENISFVQWAILMNLRDGLRLTAAELCHHLCHDSGALTRVIDQMEERRWIRRRRSARDRRMVALELTKEGRKMSEAFLSRVVKLYNDLLGDFTQEEITMFIGLLTRFIGKLEESKGGR